MKHGRIERTRQNLIRGRELSDIFKLERPELGIKLQRVSGPFGPIYWATDGSHRVASSKYAQMEWIAANIKDVETHNETFCSKNVLNLWNKLADSGLINIEAQKIENDEVWENYSIKILDSNLSWIILAQWDAWTFIQINQAYNKIYPGSIEEIADEKGIPPEALLDLRAYFEWIGL